MHLIIREMANLPVSEEMLKDLDVPSLLRDFKNDYEKLGDLKQVRTKHEQRNAFSRWWHSDEMEDAELDAVELQASFSKKLGKLTVIALYQSQTLNQHQEELQLQQQEIKEQTSAIAAANETIKEQQALLADQQGKLQELIRDYFELKGLTINEAKKLIEIASEIKSTKSDLLTALAAKQDEFVELREHVEACVRKQAAQSLQMKEQREQINRALTDQNEKLADQIAAHDKAVDARLLAQAAHFCKEHEALRVRQQQFDEQCQTVEQSLIEFRQQHIFQETQLKNQLARLKRLVILGLGGAAAALLWLGWLNRALLGL